MCRRTKIFIQLWISVRKESEKINEKNWWWNFKLRIEFN